jgi:hypothetical protein
VRSLLQNLHSSEASMSRTVFQTKQLHLISRPAARAVPLTTVYDATNREAAEIILGNVAKYGGETAGVVVWARAVLRRLKDERAGRI